MDSELDKQPTKALAVRASHGAFWLTAARFVEEFTRMGRMAVLARLLTKDDFGEFAIVLAVAGLTEVLTVTGAAQATLARRRIDAPFLDTTWVVTLVRGLLLFAVLFVASYPVAAFCGKTSIRLLIQVFAGTLVFNGLMNPGQRLRTRELDLKLVTILDVISEFVSTAGMIALAFVLRSALALAIGAVVRAAMAAGCSYVVHPFRPHFRVTREAFLYMRKFGYRLTVGALIGYGMARGSYFYIVKVFGDARLGEFHMAQHIVTGVLAGILVPILTVAVPIFRELRDDRERLLPAYRRYTGVIFLLAVPIAAGLILVAPTVVLVLAGRQWISIIPLVRLMAPLIVLECLQSINKSTFMVYERPGQEALLRAGDLVAFAATIHPLARLWGLVGVGVARVIAGLVSLPMGLHLAGRLLGCSMGRLLRPAVGPLLAAAAMVPVVYLCREWVNHWRAVPRLAVLGAVGAACYAGGILLFAPHIWKDLRGLARKVLGGEKGDGSLLPPGP